MSGPVLTTRRLTLRLPEERDFETFAAFVADERSAWVGGPGSRDDARDGFDENLAHWRSHGFGYFHVIDTASGRVLGRAGIRASADRPEPEVAYSLYAQADEGKGLAREAAQAVRDWGFDHLGLASLVSYINPANTPSVRLAEAMGAFHDGAAPGWQKYPDVAVYRHPAPAMRRAIATERLVLRAPGPGDIPAMIAFYRSERSAMAGSNLDETRAALAAYGMFGHWAHRGYGLFVLRAAGSETPLGLAGPFYPPGRPEPEIGWVLFEGHEGQGFATEAARATRDYARSALGWDEVVSYIAPPNAASVRVAERLGARLDADAPQPKPGVHTLVYRHPSPGNTGSLPGNTGSSPGNAGFAAEEARA